jgi:hypothetical protein
MLINPMMEAIRSSDTSALISATWHNIPEDGLLLSHGRENLKSYISAECLEYVGYSKPLSESLMAITMLALL